MKNAVKKNFKIKKFYDLTVKMLANLIEWRLPVNKTVIMGLADKKTLASFRQGFIISYSEKTILRQPSNPR